MKTGRKSSGNSVSHKRTRRKTPPKRDIEQLFQDHSLVQAALHQGVRAALKEHKAAGRSIVIWRDGKVVHLPPEEIQVDEEPAKPKEKPA